MPLDIPIKPYGKNDLISVDDHMVEPRDLWASRAPAKFKDKAPVVVVDTDGNEKWKILDQPLRGVGGLNALAGRKFEEYTQKTFNFSEMRPGCYDPKARVQDMDVDGVKAQMCFPSVAGLGGETLLNVKDRDYQLWAIKAYNDYLIEEFQASAPGRLYGHALIPWTDVEDAIAELKRVKGKGIVGVCVPSHLNVSIQGAPHLADPAMDPIWSACEELEIPVSMHIGGGGPPRAGAGAANAIFAGTPGLAAAGIHSAPLSNFNVLAEIIWLGMLDRHPRLKVISTEGGIGWLGYFIERGDWTWERQRHWTQSKIQKPSFYFHRQCYGAFLDDPSGIALRYTIGVENILWESDYPHSDTTWPFSHQRVNESLGHVPENERRKIVYDNAVTLFKLK
jgi:predicted TIM-barrel fold metal-dependent hydrolase